MNFYDILAAEKWGGGVPSINFFDLLFAQSISGGEQWQTYEGTLPATINANGDNLRQYQIYGNTGGVGDRTENILDESTLVKGFYDIIDGEIIINPIAKGSTVFRSFRQSLTPGTYTVSFKHNVNIVRAIVDDVISSNVAENISSYTVTTQTGDIGFSMRRTTSSQTPWDNNPTMLTEGSTPPASFVPFGYVIPISVQVGELRQDIVQGGWNGENGGRVTPYNTGAFAPIRCRIDKFYVDRAKTYTISLVPSTLQLTIKAFDADNIQRSDTGWIDTYVGTPTATIIGFAITIRKPDNSNISPADVQCVKIITSEATTTPIYIGDDPLDKDEYISYAEGKIYRMIDSTLTPTDPPVTLPALPTCEGETVIDYTVESVAPEKVLFEYAKGGN